MPHFFTNIAVLTFLLWPLQARADFEDYEGLSQNSINYYTNRLHGEINRYRSFLRDFRIIVYTTGLEFDESGDWPIAVRTYSERETIQAIATLHDYDTGEVLYSCNTPCVLKAYRNKRYRISTYKVGYLPIVRSVDANYDQEFHTDVGSNYFHVLKQRQDCFSDFKARLNEDRQAELCSQKNLPVPSSYSASGRCLAEYDISHKGKPKNIKVTNCPDHYFAARIENYIKWLLFYPEVERGVAIDITGYTEIFEYSQLTHPYRID